MSAILTTSKIANANGVRLPWSSHLATISLQEPPSLMISKRGEGKVHEGDWLEITVVLSLVQFPIT